MSRDELMELAREPSSEKRRVLLRRVTDLFLTDQAPADDVAALFEEIVLRVLKDVGTRGRTEFAESIADSTLPPRGLILHLAKDEIAVSKTILRHSPVLSEGDLQELAVTLGNEHKLALSKRDELPALVTDVLVRCEDLGVVQSLADNHGARFSTSGIETLVSRSRANDRLQLSLASRIDLPTEAADELRALLSDKVRKVLADRGLTTQAGSPSVIDELRDLAVAAMKERRREDEEVAKLVADIRTGKATAGDAIALLAPAERAHDLAGVVGALTQLDRPSAMNALTSPSDTPVIVIGKALDLSWEVFQLMLKLRATLQRRTYAESPAMARIYRSMTRPAALRILRFLQIRRAAEDVDAGDGAMRNVA